MEKSEEFQDGDVVENLRTGERLTVVGAKWWNGSWEARSHSETYEYAGEQLPCWKRVHPNNCKLIERNGEEI